MGPFTVAGADVSLMQHLSADLTATCFCFFRLKTLSCEVKRVKSVTKHFWKGGSNLFLKFFGGSIEVWVLLKLSPRGGAVQLTYYLSPHSAGKRGDGHFPS